MNAPSPPSQLPTQLTSLVGREAELAELTSLIRSSRLVTITGAAGLGKTRLAIEAARRLAADLPDEVRFVGLDALTDGALLAHEVAARLGVCERVDETLIETIASHVDSRAVLLVLDNCEHIVAACANLVEALLGRCNNMRVLATSRQRLRVPGETVWRVPPLHLPDERLDADPRVIAGSEAVRLFEERARLLQPRFRIEPDSARTVALICRRLDGIPLAIELAAARIEVMSVGDILERLEGRFRLLTSGATPIPRHKTLAAALDWGHQLLDDQERRLFRRISVFSGGFDSPAAEAVCAGNGLEVADILGLVCRLAEKSLLVPYLRVSGPTRYRFLETVRQYGVQRLLESGEAATMSRRHANYYLALAERAEPLERSPEHHQGLERLESDHDNLRAALDWCRAHDKDLWLRLAGSMTWFWVTRGHFREGREWLEGALASEATERAARAGALLGLARLSFWQGDYGSARSHCERCLVLRRELGDDRGTAWALTLLGSIHAYQGDYETSRRRLDEVLATARDDDIRMEALVAIGEMLLQTGELSLARSRLEQVQALARGPEAPRGRAALFLGLVAFLSADYPEARKQAATCLEIFERLRNRYAAAAAMDLVAGLAVQDSEPFRALKLCGAAAALRESIRARLAPRWQEVLRAVVVEPASREAADLAESAWAEGEGMAFEEAVAYAQAGLAAAPSPSRPRMPGGLSQREFEVAELVAEGMTNRQIGERLVIAQRTVEGHVERIRSKLNVRSRTQVGVWLVRQRAWHPSDVADRAPRDGPRR